MAAFFIGKWSMSVAYTFFLAIGLRRLWISFAESAHTRARQHARLVADQAVAARRGETCHWLNDVVSAIWLAIREDVEGMVREMVNELLDTCRPEFLVRPSPGAIMPIFVALSLLPWLTMVADGVGAVGQFFAGQRWDSDPLCARPRPVSPGKFDAGHEGGVLRGWAGCRRRARVR